LLGNNSFPSKSQLYKKTRERIQEKIKEAMNDYNLNEKESLKSKTPDPKEDDDFDDDDCCVGSDGGE